MIEVQEKIGGVDQMYTSYDAGVVAVQYM